MKKPKVLIVDDDESIRRVLEFTLGELYELTSVDNGERAIDVLYREPIDIILLDIKMPKLDGIEALKKIQKIAPGADVIMLTATMDSGVTSEAMHLGAVNYLTKPFEMDDLLAILQRISRKRDIVDKGNTIQDHITSTGKMADLVGESQVMQSVRLFVREASQQSVTVLLTGDKGVELDTIAHALFSNSLYQETLVTINCAVNLTENIEEALFGSVQESGEEQQSTSIGFFNLHRAATLYLKNIEFLPITMQKRLVSWFESGDPERGGAAPGKRLIASSTVNLVKLVKDHVFDEELFHYLNERSIYIPPLTARPDDIPVLCAYFLDKYTRESGKNCTLTPKALHMLASYSWPGNTLELSNCIRRLVLIATDNSIDERQLPVPVILSSAGSDKESTVEADSLIAAFETLVIRDAYARCGGNTDLTAMMLAVSRERVVETVSP